MIPPAGRAVPIPNRRIPPRLEISLLQRFNLPAECIIDSQPDETGAGDVVNDGGGGVEGVWISRIKDDG
ncbi:MAG: hypothetical protein V2A61_03210 [Calditrichota bacterium]